MREILFRGKNKDIGWVYGQLAYDIDGDAYIIQEVEIDTSYGLEENMLLATIWYRVDKETIGQYTGLKDKNGVKIYDGDLIKNNLHNVYNEDIGGIWYVKFGEYDNSDTEYGSSGNIGFYACDIIYGHEEGLNNLTCDDNDYIKVIGNIHDNPNLLEEGE